MVNPQLGTPYCTVQVPLYDGDTYMRVADRIRRTSGIPGNVAVNLLRYKNDAHSIPVYEEQERMIGIGIYSHFSIVHDKAYLSDPENDCEAVAIGTQLQYIVDVQHS